MACVDVDDHDPLPMASASGDTAIEGDLGPIGGPCRGAVDPAFGGMGDLADVASIGVHRENGVAVAAAKLAVKDDQTLGGSSATALALVVLLVNTTLSRVSTSTGGQ